MKPSTNKNEELNKGEIVIYKTARNTVELSVRLENESVWMTQGQIAILFDKDRTVITKHIKAVFQDKEVDQKSNVHFLHIATSDKPVAFYGLDVVLAVGYRTNSAKAIHFRKWSTSVLKKYLLEGYAINEKRITEAQEKIKELQNEIKLLNEKVSK